jgi:hypothetical protein
MVAIPSYRRGKWLVEHERPNTIRALGGVPATLFVRADDPELDAYFFLAKATGKDLQAFNARANGVCDWATTMDYIINVALERYDEHLLVLDDDISFNIHNLVLGAKPDFVPATVYLGELFSHAVAFCGPKCPMMSFPPVFMRSQDNIVSYCHPMQMAHMLYLPFFRAHPEMRFGHGLGEGMKAYSDFNLTLNVLESGHLVAYLSTVILSSKFNAPGGCSTYRSLAVQQSGVSELIVRHPEFVRTHERYGWQGDKSIKFVGPTVSWKKSFNHDKFRERFGVDPKNYAKEVILQYEGVYADFVKRAREEA